MRAISERRPDSRCESGLLMRRQGNCALTPRMDGARPAVASPGVHVEGTVSGLARVTRAGAPDAPKYFLLARRSRLAAPGFERRPSSLALPATLRTLCLSRPFSGENPGNARLHVALSFQDFSGERFVYRLHLPNVYTTQGMCGSICNEATRIMCLTPSSSYRQGILECHTYFQPGFIV